MEINDNLIWQQPGREEMGVNGGTQPVAESGGLAMGRAIGE